MASPLFRVLSAHPRLGSVVLRWPVVGIRYARWLWCQRQPVGLLADVVGLRRVM